MVRSERIGHQVSWLTISLRLQPFFSRRSDKLFARHLLFISSPSRTVSPHVERVLSVCPSFHGVVAWFLTAFVTSGRKDLCRVATAQGSGDVASYLKWCCFVVLLVCCSAVLFCSSVVPVAPNGI